MPGTHAAAMSGVSMTLPLFMVMMVAMMLPSAAPGIVRLARDSDGLVAAPLFTGAYLGVWAVAGLVMWLLYEPPSALASAVLLVTAGLYELTPLKRACRRQCRERVRSGARFGSFCVGSSAGLMLVLVAVDVMSLPLMVLIAAVVLAQKLLPPVRALDLSLALGLLGLGVAAVAA